MPYIKKDFRGLYNGYIKSISNIVNKLPKDAKSGHINYITTKLLHMTLPIKYNDYNSLIGALECIKLELYRRKITPYEDIKIKENGDV